MAEIKFERLPNMTVKQSIFIQALAMGNSIQEACRMACISVPTGYKWKNEADFDKLLITLKNDIVNTNLSKLINALNLAVENHIQILNDPKTMTSQKLKAIDMLYNQVHWFAESENIQKRMDELEQIFAERN